MHGNRDGGVGYSPNICQLFLAYLLDCLAILGTVCVHAGKLGQTDAIYSQLDINLTLGVLLGVYFQCIIQVFTLGPCLACIYVVSRGR